MTPKNLRKAALEKKLRAANRWYLGQRLLDLLFALAITGCVLVGYYRHIFLAITLLVIVMAFAWLRWRHWDTKDSGGGVADVWDIDDSTTDHWNNDPSDSSDSSSHDSASDF